MMTCVRRIFSLQHFLGVLIGIADGTALLLSISALRRLLFLACSTSLDCHIVETSEAFLQQSPPYREQVGGPATFCVDRLEILLLVRPLGFLYLADAGWATAAVSAPLARVSWDGDFTITGHTADVYAMAPVTYKSQCPLEP